MISKWEYIVNCLIETAKYTNENLTKKELAKKQLKKLNETRPNKEKNLLNQNLTKETKEFIEFLIKITIGEE